MRITLRLPVPPSLNQSTRNVRGIGRVKTKKYKDWLKEADKWFLLQKRGLGQIRGKCSIMIEIPPVSGDISNRIKAAEDFCVSRGITDDDRNNQSVYIHVNKEVDCCVVTIVQAGA